MRSFIAVPAGADFLELAKTFQCADFAGAKLVPPENHHITLKFLGDIEEAAPAADLCRKAAAQTSKFLVTIGGAGVFKKDGGFVLWLSAEDESKGLANLAGILGAPGGFKAHITMARFKTLTGMEVALKKAQSLRNRFSEIKQEVTAFSLYSSILSGGAPKYEILETFSLK